MPHTKLRIFEPADCTKIAVILGFRSVPEPKVTLEGSAESHRVTELSLRGCFLGISGDLQSLTLTIELHLAHFAIPDDDSHSGVEG